MGVHDGSHGPVRDRRDGRKIGPSTALGGTRVDAQHLVAADDEPSVVDPPAPIWLHVGVDILRHLDGRRRRKIIAGGRVRCDRIHPATVGPHGLRPLRSKAVRAWILDESPGSYRWGDVDAPEPGPDDVRVRVVASALNHMDLWVTRGSRSRRCRTCPAATWPASSTRSAQRSTGVAVGDEVVVNPAVSPLEDIVALGQRQPDGRRLHDLRRALLGRPRATCSSCPARNVVARPAGPRRGRSARPTRWLPHRLPHAAPRPAAGRATRCWSSGIGSRRVVRRPGSRPDTWAPRCTSPVAVTRRSASRRSRWARPRRIDSAEPSGRSRPTSSSRASARRRGSIDRVRSLKPGGRMVVCGGTSGRGRAEPAPPVLQAVRDHRLVDGQLPRSSPTSRGSSTRASPIQSTRSSRSTTTRRPSPASSRARNSARSCSATQ